MKYSFLNLSIKTYDGHIEALNYFYKRMLPGGVLLLDDYFNRRFPMAQEAINDFFEDKQESLIQYIYKADDDTTIKKVFVVKL